MAASFEALAAADADGSETAIVGNVEKEMPNPANQEILSKYELFKISDENSRDYRCLEHVNCLGVSKECIK